MWDNVPYELQSPRWRNALNQSAGTANGSWDPSLNMDIAANFLNAQIAADKKAVGVNTSQIDGQSNFIGNLAGFGSALLQSIGVRNDAGTQPVQATPASWSRSGNSLDTSTLLLVGAVGLGVYFLAKS